MEVHANKSGAVECLPTVRYTSGTALSSLNVMQVDKAICSAVPIMSNSCYKINTWAEMICGD